MRRIWVLFLLCFSIERAFADPFLASIHFTEAEKQYQAADYIKALDQYAAAYREAQDAAYIFNLAQCYRKLGDNAAAIVLFTRYLQESPTATNRAQVEESILYLQQTPSTAVMALPDLNPAAITVEPSPPEKEKKAFLYTIGGAATLLAVGGVLAFFLNGPGVPNTALGHQDGFRE
jgi:tetratricopeptide (TPR) repeat protein